MANPKYMRTEIVNTVMVITFDRPKVNAFNLEMITEFSETLEKAARDDTVRCILVTGQGKTFSAGHDVLEINQKGDTSVRIHLEQTYNRLILQIRQVEKPVIAAINGTVSGAALGIALACDLRIAVMRARFVVGFGGIGLAPDSGVSLLLPLFLGIGRATEFMFTNQPFSAEQALNWGLINRLEAPENFQAQALNWANDVAQGPIHTMGLAKRELNKAVLGNLEEILDYEAQIQEIAAGSAEHREGINAFLHKRKPDFYNLG